ncbi:hypothetical protein pipiens_018911 [Culex pipiens pipiens]|uniref:Cytochrome P450 n=1 Tax=Culex pipiens pipiens TaxID=38569 RepID=A0ABD1DZ57_CULPP
MFLVIFFVISLLTLAYRAFRYRLTYWTRHGIPQLQPAIPFGDFGPVFRQKRFYGELLQDLYLQSKHLPLVGIYLTFRPVLIAVDPELIKAILVRDADCFSDRGRWQGGAVAVDGFNLMRIAFYFLAPKFKNWLGIKFVDSVVESFMISMVRKISEHREHEKGDQDLIQMLLELRSSDLALKDEIVAAHALFFIIGSYEASTTTTSFCLYELAKNVDIQQKAQQEIDSVISKEEGELTVENLADMRYVDCCINETYRKYPQCQSCSEDVPRTTSCRNTTSQSPSGSTVVIPLLGLANDPEFFPNPEAFLPERFENKPDYGLPFYPFGAGPRSCIAKRLGHLQTKVALVMLLAKFDIALANPDAASVRFDPKFFITKAVGGLNLVFTKRD